MPQDPARPRSGQRTPARSRPGLPDGSGRARAFAPATFAHPCYECSGWPISVRRAAAHLGVPAWRAAAIGLFALAGVARADYDEKNIAEISRALKQGRPLDACGVYPYDKAQQIHIALPQISCKIDFRTQLCFAGAVAREATAGIPPIVRVHCSAIKKGYPLFAPLIAWDD